MSPVTSASRATIKSAGADAADFIKLARDGVGGRILPERIELSTESVKGDSGSLLVRVLPQDQTTRHHVVQRLALLGEWLYEVANQQEHARQVFAKVATGGA